MIKPYYETAVGQIYCGDALKILKILDNCSVQCCITSPPYWGLRNYGVEGQLGLEKTPEEYVVKTVGVFREIKRVLKNDGTVWLNLGDSYIGGGRAGKDGIAYGGIEAQNRCNRKVKWGSPTGKIDGLKPKDLVGIPWRVAFALQADGWYLRQDIIWHKPNPMPESVKDRCTKAHEYIFLLTKTPKYYYDADAIRENRTSLEDANSFRGGCYINQEIDNSILGKRKVVGNKKIKVPDIGRNKRSVWTIATQPFPEAHFATFPEKLIEPCVLAGTKKGDIILDPFAGALTTGVVAYKHDRKFIGIELNPEYCEISVKRIKAEIQQLKLFQA